MLTDAVELPSLKNPAADALYPLTVTSMNVPIGWSAKLLGLIARLVTCTFRAAAIDLTWSSTSPTWASGVTEIRAPSNAMTSRDWRKNIPLQTSTVPRTTKNMTGRATANSTTATPQRFDIR